MIYTVIAKPTKACNADCSYCSAPPDDESAWTIDEFKLMFDRLEDKLADNAFIIWHGGEPLLMKPEFYEQAYEYAKSKKPGIRFSVQTNILLYKSSRWKKVFQDVFKGSVSTSFDPDEQSRTIKGNTEVYSRTFFQKLDELIGDGFHPLIIGTYTNETIQYAHRMYDLAQKAGPNYFDIRYNYRYPAGRAANTDPAISPENYGDMLLTLWDRWVTDAPNFLVTPLDQMLRKVLGENLAQCPWTRKCGGTFLSIEPNGDLYNCGEFADLGKPEYRFGNVKEGWVPGSSKRQIVNLVRKSKPGEFSDDVVNTKAMRLMKRRKANVPLDCSTCRHFKECEGGCMRDAELFDRGLGGKFYYCASWKMVFDKIKADVVSGRADKLLETHGKDVEAVKRYVNMRIAQGGT